MTHYDALYPGRFLKGTTLAGPTVIRIVGIKGEALEGDDGAKAKGVLKYKGASGEGEIVWCKTNAALTAAVLGTPDVEQWAGRLITIWHDPDVTLGRDKVGGIRVYGSPELAADKVVEIKRPRRKMPDRYTLRRTDKNGNTTAPATAQKD